MKPHMFIITLMACFSANPQEILQPLLHSGQEEYQIYSSIIDSCYLESKYTSIVLLDSAITRSSYKADVWAISATGKRIEIDSWYQLGMLWPDLENSRLKESFIFANRTRHPLSADSLSVDAPIRLISRHDIIRLFKKISDGWKTFYEEYPSSHGILRFSRVGFDRKMNMALVYTEHSYGQH